jgi:demethylmenaquinone methyltransferase/2-methoxy-6-polyprenyl-1,4-benzoquinol methylase
VYGLYSRRILPLLGGWITGAPDAYRYLPESIRKFPNAPELADDMRHAGFADVSWEYLTGGAVALHRGAARD